MKKNLKYILLGVGVIVIVALGIILTIVLKPKNFEKTEENVVNYVCTMKEEGTEYNTVNIVLNIKTVNGRVIEEESYTKLEFSNQDMYNSTKNGNYSFQYSYDDKNMIVNMDIKTEDMTKTSNGDDLELNYEEYKAELVKAGFSCK